MSNENFNQKDILDKGNVVVFDPEIVNIQPLESFFSEIKKYTPLDREILMKERIMGDSNNLAIFVD